MAKGKPSFNPSLGLPVTDILVAAVLVFATGYFWFQTTGQDQLEQGYEEWRQARARNAQELREARGGLQADKEDLAEIKAQRDAKAQMVVFLEEQIQQEQDNIEEGQRLDQEYTDRLLDLRLDIQEIRDRRMAYNTDIFEAEGKIETATEETDQLSAQAMERNEEIARIEEGILAARTALEHDPPSRFPERSSLASVVELAATDEMDERFVVSLARGFHRVGALDVGLLGSLGLGSGANSSIKEGGLFANLLLAHRRASIDFEGGISQLQSRETDESETSPFAGATLRLAPYRRERLFLLAGTRYSHEDLGLRLGLGFGRR